MRSDRGPGFGTADPSPAAAAKTGSTDSLEEAPPTPQPVATQRSAVASAGVDGGFTSDPDEDTATFKSALTSSEAIRRREDAPAMNAAGEVAAEPAAPQPAAGPARPGAPPPERAADAAAAKLWRGGDGRSVRDMLEHSLAGDESTRLGSGSRLQSSGPESLGPDSLSLPTSGPESLSLTPLEDDYYEDFTLPGTHEAVMSRQKSFRRRVRAAPVTEPDADRIERLVRAGELERHGSIRRRLVAPAAPAAASPGRFGRDLREIEELMAEDGDQVALDELPSLGPVLGSSTPKTPGDQPGSLPPLDEPLSLENSALMRIIRECLDTEKLKDIYTISGRLQDILTQEDIQEILEHSEMYAELLGEAILAELRSSISESPPRPAAEPSPAAGQEPSTAAAQQLPTPAPRGRTTPRAELSSDSETDEAGGAGRRISVEAEVSRDAEPPPAPAPRNTITVEAEVNAEPDSEPERPPAVSPRLRIAVEPAIGADPEMPHADGRDGPASLPTAPAAGGAADAGGALWRSGSLRRLAGAGRPPVEALFAESGAAPAGQRRLPAPAISLEDSEPLGGDSVISSPDRTAAKPADADSGVSEGAPADWQPSGDDSVFLEQALTPGQSAARPSPQRRPERPGSLSQRRRKKISVSADVLADEDSMSASSVSQLDSDTEPVTPTDGLVTSDLLDTLTPDDIETPDELEDSILERLPPAEPIPEYTAREEMNNERSWRTCVVAGLERRIDMKVIEPYKKVLSHGGYLGMDGDQAIIVFSACYLPDRSRRDYSYVMDNLFLYVLTTLDSLIAEDYVLIYLHGATQRSCMPSFGWLKRCYQMVDRRLRKNLKGLYLVHPTFWVKTIVALTRPFISSKFSRKLRFVAGLRELSQLVPMDHVCIPDRVKQLDFQQMIAERKKQLGIR